MTEYFNNLPIKGTKSKRQLLKFRDVEKIDKRNSKKKKAIGLAKRRWLEYNTPRESNYFIGVKDVDVF